MQYGALTLIAPALSATGHSEAELLGQATWLWMQSKRHRELPIHALGSLLLPAIKRQQFALATVLEAGEPRPAAFVSWANFSAEAEARYRRHSARPLPAEDWRSGDRMWYLDWITPFGHSRALARAMRELLPRSCQRGLDHRQPGLVNSYRGVSVSRAEADHWWAERPLLPL